MSGIALIADKKTVTCFKLAGLSNVHTVEDANEVEKCLQTLLEEKNPKIVLVSERILNKVQIFEKIADRQSPLVIPIPDIKGPTKIKTDLIVELIKRKTGIEIKF